MQLLAFLAARRLRGYLYDRDTIVTALTDGAIAFAARRGGYLSVFSHSEKSSGVALKGLKYPLDNAVLTNTYPLGVSNEFTGSPSRVSVACGTLLVIFPGTPGAIFFNRRTDRKFQRKDRLPPGRV
jgi:thiamine pyrophosphokinase